MDLSKREQRGTAVPRKTFRRESTMPRQATDRPDLEVVQPIRRPDVSGAQELSRVLGLANEVGQAIVADRREAGEERDAGDAAFDFAEGRKDGERFAKSHAYFAAYQREGAKRLAINISDEVTAALTDRLNDAEHPATLEEADALIEGVFQKHTQDEDGQLLDFGTAEAKAILGHALMETRTKLLPQVQEAIKGQMDEQLLQAIVQNRVSEHKRGAPIGAPQRVSDPLAPLPEGSPVDAPVAPYALGDEPDLAAVPGAPSAASRSFDLEGALAAVPPSINRHTAKLFILQAVINQARAVGDPSLLAGLEESEHADGTRTLTPDEAATVIDARLKIEERAAKKQDRDKADLWEHNHDSLVLSLLSDNPPSLDFIAEAARRGQIDPDFAFSLKHTFEAEQRQDEREARADERQARAEAEADIDRDIASRIAERSTGVGIGSAADDNQLLQSGALGTGKRAASRFRQLRAASRAGEQLLTQNPEAAGWGAKIKQFYGTKPAGSTSLVAKSRGAGSDYDPAIYSAMIGGYWQKVKEGAKPAEAYLYAVSTYGPKGNLGVQRARQNRIKLLEGRLRSGR